VTIRIVRSDAATTRALRRAVLRPTWPPDAAMHGDDDTTAVHIAAFDEEELVAACLLLRRPYRLLPNRTAWQLRGMVTAPGRRGEGIGGRLLAAAVEEARGNGVVALWCEARTSAMRFYQQHGFTVDSEEYLHSETAIPHHLMSRAIETAADGSGT
jgi:predicted GNAT family N-acyltransferase